MKNEESITVSAPATIGNIGPGFDVLGLAISGLADIVEISRIESGISLSVQTLREDMELSCDPNKNTAGIAARETLSILGIKDGVDIKLRKGLPLGSGLGSSAASAAAAAFAVNELYGGDLTKEELILPSTQAEAEVSGGFFADNTAPALLGGATLTRSCLPLDVTRIGSISDLILIVVTPDIVILTREAREILPKEVSLDKFVYNMANTSLITAAFAKDDYSLFARSLDDVVIEPVRASLIKGYDDVKSNAIKAGADGVAISGSGPTVFAITNQRSRARFIEDAMLRSFKAHNIDASSIITEVDTEGCKVI